MKKIILLLLSVFIINIFAITVQEKKQIFLSKVLPVVQKVYADNLKNARYVHPISITLAQAAMESGWGTSRFFREANNIFGVWSYDAKGPRIAAKQKRQGKTIWLKKYNSLEESVQAYYKTISRKRVYAKFRELNAQGVNVYELVKELRMYSEKRDVYAQELAQIIRFNKFTQYDVTKATSKASQ